MRLIDSEDKKLKLGTGSKEYMKRLEARKEKLCRAWVFDNYVVTASGSYLMFCARMDRLGSDPREPTIKRF